jgi:hypothetical protein
LTNRYEAKVLLSNLINISPNVDFEIDDIYIYPKKAIFNFNLEPKTKYTINLSSFPTDI